MSLGALVDNFKGALKMSTDYDDYGTYDDDEIGFEDEEEYTTSRNSRSFFKKNADEDSYDEKQSKPAKSLSKVTSFSSRKQAKNSGYPMEIKSIRPRSYDDSSLITDELLDGNSVIINFSSVDKVTAEKIIDFTSGSVYALKGSFKKVSDSVFTAVPAGVNIDGAFADDSEE